MVALAASSDSSRPRHVASPKQCRAGRALLNWTQAQLAREASVARKTIADFEAAERLLRYRTRRHITEALERGGVEFIWATDGEGVKTAKPLRHHGLPVGLMKTVPVVR